MDRQQTSGWSVTSGRRVAGAANWEFVAQGLTVVAAAAVVIALVWLALRPDPRFAFADVTWAEVTPPGAVVLPSRGHIPPGENLVGGRLYLGTNQSEDEIRAFYRDLFARHPGWVPDGSLVGIRWSDEIDACTWRNTKLTFRLGLQDMGGWRELRAPDRGPATVFSIQVLDTTSAKVRNAACATDR
ncbi:MAG: hypothetical protein U0838_17550 [Chloroflexota bacterium]